MSFIGFLRSVKYGKVKEYFCEKKNRRLENKCRKRLKNKNFTILSSNCIAGMIYNRLGQQFLTPTINMYFSQRDFIKFCLKLDYYINSELVFINSDLGYPVATLGENDDKIKLFFNHHTKDEDAKYDWDRRKTRINYNNLFIIFYRSDFNAPLSVEEIRQIEKVKCRGVAVLSDKPVPLDYVYTLKKSKYIEGRNKDYMVDKFIDYDKYGIRKYEKQFDFVSFLNGEKR